VGDPDRIDRGGEILGLVFSCVALLLLNFHSDKVGALISLDGDGEFIPLLGPAYHQYLPWWNVYLVGGAVTAMLLLARDRHMWALRSLDFGLALLLVAILWWMIHGEPLMRPDFVGMGGAVSDPEVVERFEEVVAPIVRVVLRAGLWV
jgi:hypothetical protein